MFGRTRERKAMDGLLLSVRLDRGGALVLRGEAGVGKSALLSYATGAAKDMRVLRCVGTEAETDIPFAGLHQLLRPMSTEVRRLPMPDRQALESVLGLVPDEREPFAVGAALCALMASATERGPVLCLVDDEQWLDRATVDVVSSLARRLGPARLAVMAATRGEPWDGVRCLEVGGLDRAAALALLRSVAPQLTVDTLRQLVESTGGTPGSLLEIARWATDEQVREGGAGRFPDRLRGVLLRQVHGLPPPVRRILLVIAAAEALDPTAARTAAQRLGLQPSWVDDTLRTGLIRTGDADTIAFREPIVGRAVYQEAALLERTGVHQVLAELYADEPVRRADHLAASKLGPDEGVAAELAGLAEWTTRHGRHETASTTYERAAERSEPGTLRSRRMAAAAAAAYDAGRPDRAAALAARARHRWDQTSDQAGYTAMCARIELCRGSPDVSHALYLDAARLSAQHDPDRAFAVLLEAAVGAESVGSCRRLRAVASELAKLTPEGHPLHPVADAHVGLADLYDGLPAGSRRIRSGVLTMVRAVESGNAQYLDGGSLASELALAVGDDTSGRVLAGAAVEHCRSLGLVGRLPYELTSLARVELSAGEFASARTYATEAHDLFSSLGEASGLCLGETVLSLVDAFQGRAEACRERATAAALSADKSLASAVSEFVPSLPLGVLELAAGRFEQALAHLLDAERRMAYRRPFIDALLVPALVEAATRAGRSGEIAEPLARFTRWAGSVSQPWAEAVACRCQALLAAGDPEASFVAALRAHAAEQPPGRPFERARTQLLYGEWLRRRRRRGDARAQLAEAVRTFVRLDAAAWADRAAAELHATAQTLRRPGWSKKPRLTPQELRVVRLAAEGGSNKDIATRLLLSPRTVGYHLSNAFAKLGVSSRGELARLDIDAFT